MKYTASIKPLTMTRPLRRAVHRRRVVTIDSSVETDRLKYHFAKALLSKGYAGAIFRAQIPRTLTPVSSSRLPGQFGFYFLVGPNNNVVREE